MQVRGAGTHTGAQDEQVRIELDQGVEDARLDVLGLSNLGLDMLAHAWRVSRIRRSHRARRWVASRRGETRHHVHPGHHASDPAMAKARSAALLALVLELAGTRIRVGAHSSGTFSSHHEGGGAGQLDQIVDDRPEHPFARATHGRGSDHEQVIVGFGLVQDASTGSWLETMRGWSPGP